MSSYSLILAPTSALRSTNTPVMPIWLPTVRPLRSARLLIFLPLGMTTACTAP